MMKNALSLIPTLLALAACTTSNNASIQPGESAVANTLSSAEQAQGWRLLFDGRRMDQWRGYRAETLPAGWHVANGTLAKETETGDIVTKEKFGDFELAFDWKIGPGGNSGVFYRGTEEYDAIYWSAPEYQLLDDALHPDGKSRLTAAGSNFGLYPSPAGVVDAANEWNATRIVVRGAHVEHWLNGQKLLQYDLWSPEWEAKLKASKFHSWPNFGRARTGHIGIQGDHPGLLALRNIRIRELR